MEGRKWREIEEIVEKRKKIEMEVRLCEKEEKINEVIERKILRIEKWKFWDLIKRKEIENIMKGIMISKEGMKIGKRRR